ncbi:MAG: twin-arginine translocase TatA/TatE family subunit [Bacteroidales bacterium]|nr:twin-arginine translocase TatA/TatE family subunit [Bacteroidales bacterium]
MMLSMVLFISGGEIFIILLAILIFFGADKIPEFARMMGKGVREFKKATDDIKREFNENSSGIMDDIKSIRDDMTGIGSDLTHTLTKGVAEPMQETANETAKTFEEYQDPYNTDYYYNNPYDIGNSGNEYRQELQDASPEVVAESAEATDNRHIGAEQANPTKPVDA